MFSFYFILPFRNNTIEITIKSRNNFNFLKVPLHFSLNIVSGKFSVIKTVTEIIQLQELSIGEKTVIEICYKTSLNQYMLKKYIQ